VDKSIYKQNGCISLRHGVQAGAKELHEGSGGRLRGDGCVGGINHQEWLLEMKRNWVGVYPEIKKKPFT